MSRLSWHPSPGDTCKTLDTQEIVTVLQPRWHGDCLVRSVKTRVFATTPANLAPYTPYVPTSD